MDNTSSSSSAGESDSESTYSPDNLGSSSTHNKRQFASSSDLEDSSKKLRMDAGSDRSAGNSPEPSASDSTQLPKGSGWRLELCSGADETLQLNRLSGTSKSHSSSRPREGATENENTFDSYRLETLAAAVKADIGALDELVESAEHWCNASISAQHIAITIGNQINVLSADCRVQEAVICHDSRILATALNCDSSFVAFGDDTGSLFIVHIKTRRPVFSQAICRPTGKPSPPGITAMLFAVSGSDGDYKHEELVLTSSDGTLVRFSNIELCLLSKAITEGDMKLAAALKNKIKVEFASLSAGKRMLHADNIGGLAVSYSEAQSSVIVAGSGSTCMSRWTRTESPGHEDGQGPPHATCLADIVSNECSGSGYVKIRLSLDQRYLLALSEHGTLDIYETSTLTLVFRYSDIPIDDFGVVAPSSASSSSIAPAAITFVAISKPVPSNVDGDEDGDEEDELCRKLVVVSLPSMDLLYTMDVSLWSWLANDIRSAQDIADTIIFLEGTVKDNTQSVFLRSLCETMPLERLTHYLRGGRYAEAEMFAEACNIPMSIVYRKRLEELLNVQDIEAPASRDGNEHEAAKLANEIVDMLGHIDDAEFAVDVCIRVHISSYRQTRRLLQHARSLVADDSDAVVVIEQAIQRLGTWQTISTSQAAARSAFDSRGWHIFRETDLAACLRSYIASGDIARASVLWRRHQHDKRLLGDISSAISGFPLNVETKPLVSWLRTEVFPSIQTRQQWHEVASWIEQRARTLEAKQKSPSDALLLVELLDIGAWTGGHGSPSSALSSNRNTNSAALAGSSIDGPFAVTPQRFIDNSLRASAWTIGLAQFSGADIFPSASSDESHTADGDTGMQSCKFLHKQLLDLAYLREKHNMTLTLEEYDNLSYSMIATEFLDRVAAPELLPEAYFGHFVPYATRHQLDYPPILQEYCIETMDAVDREDASAAHAQEDTTGDINAPNLAAPSMQGHHSWEPRVLQLLSCLHRSSTGKRQSSGSSDDIPEASATTALPGSATLPLTTSRESMLATYLDIVLEAMRRSSIPWSSGIDKTIEDSLKLLERYASLDSELRRRELEIKEQHRLMCLKRMLLSHGLADFHISNTKMASPLLQWLVRKTDSETIMADALQLVDAYHHLSRTSAYVLRLQALCESCDAGKVGEFISFIDETEHGSGAGRKASKDSTPRPDSALDSDARASDSQTITKYVPMEVARRTFCWIHEVLDNMSFTGESSRAQFKQFAGAGMAIVRSLEALAEEYKQAAQSTDQSARHSCTLSTSLLDRLHGFLAGEKDTLGVVWQLLTDGGIMVSPGELEQRHMRSQILGELLEQQWLQAYISKHQANGAEKPIKGKGKGKGTGLDASNTEIPIGMLSLPPTPTNIKTLARMLGFSATQLCQKVISATLSLGLLTMALDACQHLIETLKPLQPSALPPSSTGTDTTTAAGEEWHAAINSLAICEQSISAYLARANGSSGNDGEQLPTEKMQGRLVKRLVTVCQAAGLKCAYQPHLASFLDAYSSWELAHSIFSQTTDGDFAELTKAPLPASTLTSASSKGHVYTGGNGSSSSSSSSSSAAAAAAAVAAAGSSSVSASMQLGQDLLHSSEGMHDNNDNASSSWLNPMFTNTYIERGLVLDTAKAMSLAYRLIAVLRRLPNADTSERSIETSDITAISGDNDSKTKATKVSLGKSADRSLSSVPRDDVLLDNLDVEELRFEAIRRCQELVVYLAHNRHWMLAIQVLELVVSQLSRSSFVIQADAEHDDSVESLNLLRQRLSSGGISKEELEALFESENAGSAKPNTVDIQGLASKSLVTSLQQRGIDSIFIFSCMLMTPDVKAYQCLSTAMSHSGLLPSRVIALATIGSACSLVWQQQAMLDRCRSIAAAARWSEQLQLLQIKFDVSLLSHPKPQLLERLIRPMLVKTSMDITTVLEFASEFRLDETFAILEYISLCCTAPNIDGYQARVLGIEDEIANTKLLERTYVDSLEGGASAYDYERLQFIVQRLQELRPQDKGISRFASVLDILCSYDRKTKPTYDELLQEWARTQASRSALQQFSADATSAQKTDSAEPDPPYPFLVAQYPLAEKRLPFHYLVNATPWTALLPELSVETVDLLIPLAAPLNLNEDDFYMNLIDGMLKQWKANSPSAGGELDAATAYELATIKTPTHFNSIHQLIRCFKDPEAAISTIKHAADELPCGPDRIAALKMGIKLLYKWGQYIKRMAEPERSQMMTKAETIYMHFEKSFTDATAEVTLRKNGLEKYLALFVHSAGTESMVQALTAVYEGECESALCEPKREGREVLHEILRNLAAIYDISLDSLLKKMLDAYLEKPIVLDESTAQLQLPSTRYQASLGLPASQEAKLRRRIVCILRVYSVDDAISSLLGFAYASKGGISCLGRARALEILFSLASHDDIAKVQQPSHVRRYFQALLYLADFEFAGIPQSTSDFLECSKAALARSIWIDHHQDPKVIQLICNMCLDFRVDDRDLLLRMLPQLLSARMFRYTAGVLEIVSNMPCYSSIAELPNFWNQAVLGGLVQIATSKDDPSWIESALMILGACLSSLYLPDIDAEAVVERLLQAAEEDASNPAPAQLAFIVLDVLPYSSSASELLSDYISAREPKQIHSLILQLLAFSDSAARMANSRLFLDRETSRSLTLIFDQVDAEGLYEQALLHHPVGVAVRAFVQNRMHHDRLATAISACMDRNKSQLATQLVSQYYRTRPIEALIDDAARAEITIDTSTDSSPGDNTTGSANGGTAPAGTDDVANAAGRLTSKLPPQLLLDIYTSSHK